MNDKENHKNIQTYEDLNNLWVNKNIGKEMKKFLDSNENENPT
jgi:hypothetical protein